MGLRRAGGKNYSAHSLPILPTRLSQFLITGAATGTLLHNNPKSKTLIGLFHSFHHM